MLWSGLQFLLLAWIIILFTRCQPCQGVLPSNILTTVRASRDDLIEHYFRLGIQYSEILHFLSALHGITLSLRQLKRILKLRDLSRNHYSSLNDIVDGIESELSGSGKLVGYRAMHQRITMWHGLSVSRETVRILLKNLDPVGVERRSRHKLTRRRYRACGPNFLWHIDGYDKLKPYGFCIHAAIDGYSRRIMWLEVGHSNNDPRLIAKYFLDYIRSVGGIPSIVRGDCGTENIHIASIQRFFRENHTDSFHVWTVSVKSKNWMLVEHTQKI